MIGEERTGRLVPETDPGILDCQARRLDFSWKTQFKKGCGYSNDGFSSLVGGY